MYFLRRPGSYSLADDATRRIKYGVNGIVGANPNPNPTILSHETANFTRTHILLLLLLLLSYCHAHLFTSGLGYD